MKLFVFLIIVCMLTGTALALVDEPIKLSTEESYHARAIAAERDKVKAEAEREAIWMQAAINQFIESTPQVKQHRDLANVKDAEYKDKMQEYQTLEAELLKDHKAPTEKYVLDASAGMLALKQIAKQ